MTFNRNAISIRIMATVATLLLSQAAFAQAPSTRTPVYTGNIGGGLARTGGNTHTSNFNLTAALVLDPKTRNIVRANAAYLRGSLNDVLNLDRTAFNIRDEYTLSGRTFVFGQTDYVRDQFKPMIFFWAPSGGIGYKLINSDSTQFIVDGGSGGVLEKNPGLPSSKSGSVNAGQRLNHKLSSAATLSESLSTIWKTQDFADSLTNFSASITTAVVGKIQLKLEFLDSYKNKPANAVLKKNDTAFVTSFVVKY